MEAAIISERGHSWWFSLLVFLAFGTAVWSQTLSVTVIMPPQPSPYLADWIAGREEVMVTVHNSGSAPQAAILKVKLYLDGELQAETDVDKLEPVTIPPGVSTFYAQDFLQLEAINFYGDSRKSVERSGRLPAGHYQFCFQLLDPQTHEPLTPLPEYCRSFTIILYTPPVLLQPADRDTVRSLTDLRFQWTPVVPAAPQPILYTLQVFEVFEGQTPMDAYLENPPVLQYTIHDGTTIPYQPELGLLQPGRTYIWTVQVTDSYHRPLFAPDGRAEPFTFVYQPREQLLGDKEPKGKQRGSDTATVVDVHVLRIGYFEIRLRDTVRCSSGGGCSISGTGTLFIPWLDDSLTVHFTNLQVTVTDTPGVARVVAGVVAVAGAWMREIFPGYPEFRLEINEWRFTPDRALLNGDVFFNGQTWDLPCVISETLPLDSLEFFPDSLRLELPTGWVCSGIDLAIGDCFTFHFDTLSVALRWDGSRWTATAFLDGTVTIACWTVDGQPVQLAFRSQILPGQVNLLLTVHAPLRDARISGLPIWLSLDSLILDASSLENPAGFPPALCGISSWSDPLWKGLWIPAAHLKFLVEQDTLQWDIRDIVLENGSGRLLASFEGEATFVPPHPIELAGFTVRLDSAKIRFCQNTPSTLRANGLLQLPASLQKPTEWARLDSLYLRLAGHQRGSQFEWLGTLDLFGGVNLALPPSNPVAMLRLQNGQIAKVGTHRGYVEFTNIDFQAPPNDPAAVVHLAGLRIWNDGQVQLEDADGWFDISSWARLHIGGLTIQVREIGIGYEGGHWWAGLSGGFEIPAASGLSGGANGMYLHRLRIFDDGRMVSDGAHVQFSIGGALNISGTLFWGDIAYGSTLTSGMTGRLTGRFDCLGGFQTGIDFAFGSTKGSSPFRFWYLSGEAAIPGGVPIIPGAFHLVGGILGAGWHVRLDNFNHHLITSSGFNSPPPIVPDRTIDLLLRAGLLFADPSLQAYLFRLTSSLALGSSFQLGLDGNLELLPAIKLASGTLAAQYRYTSDVPLLSLSGAVTVNLLNLSSIGTGFSTTFTPSNPCLQIGPLQRRWILVDMNESFGTNLLGTDVVARAYLDLATMYLRLCPSEGQFTGSIQGAGVAGALLHVAGIGHVPFHAGLSLNSDLCLRYSLKLENRPSTFWARAKAGAFLNTSVNFDYSGWWSWGWKGTQAWDHIRNNPPVTLSQHWSPCGGNKCKQAAIGFTFGSVLEGELSVPKVRITAGRHTLAVPNWLGSRPSIRYGYYARASSGGREWAKSGGNNSILTDQARWWSCSTFENEADNWAEDNRSQQQPPAFIRFTDPASGFPAVEPATPTITVVFGAPISNTCTGSASTRCWYIDRGTLQFRLDEMEDDRTTVRKSWHLGIEFGDDTARLSPQISVGPGAWANAALTPGSWYRLVITGTMRSPNPSAALPRRDTIWFRTADQMLAAQLAIYLPSAGITREGPVGSWIGVLATSRPIDQIDVREALDTAVFSFYALHPGRDCWLEIRNLRTGRRYWWRGTPMPPVQDTMQVRILGIPIGTRFLLDTTYFQPFVAERPPAMTEDIPDPYVLLPGTYEFRIYKTAGTPSSPEAQVFLDALPNPIAKWRVVKLPYASLQTTLRLALRWQSPPDLRAPSAWVQLRNAGTAPIYPGTPLQLHIQKFVESEKDTTTLTTTLQVQLPAALLPGHSLTIPISLTPSVATLEDSHDSYQVVGIRIEVVSGSAEFQLQGIRCISAGWVPVPCQPTDREDQNAR